ncbi:MAG: hypothetical protein GX219_00575 [Tissierellia bacterium]|nr:hypothetical protein [Tissierellia bacterium]
MNALERSLKYQLGSFLKNLIITMLVGSAVALVSVLFNSLIFSIKGLSLDYITFKMFFLISLFILLFGVAPVYLIIQCFMSFYADYRLMSRMGITRNNFVKSNFIFLLILILVYSSIYACVGRFVIQHVSFEDIEEIPHHISVEIKGELIKDLKEDLTLEEYEDMKSGFKKIKNFGFLDLFTRFFSFFLSIVAFIIFIAFTVFFLNHKSIIVLIPFLFISGYLTGISFLEGPRQLSTLITAVFFILSQLYIYFGLRKVNENI